MIYEKFFLDKIRGVAINDQVTAKLNQHCKNGLRALYSQFTKQKPGYILNDPINAEKNTQVVLFLTAVKHLLQQPILIICNNVESWTDTFANWTDNSTDITINCDKLSADKMIFISSLDKAVAISRRYSILVVDDADASIRVKQLKGLTAGFKIMLTSVDLKKNYKTFYTIWTDWIDPKSKETLESVFSKSSAPATLEQSILVDYLLHDKVLRRHDAQNAGENESTAKNKSTRTTIKNKDATGTKVKRSKPKHKKQAVANTCDSPTDSSRFEFETSYAACVNVNEGEIENAAVQEVQKSDEKTDEDVNTKGVKRKRGRIIQSDSESEKNDTSSREKEQTSKNEYQVETVRKEDVSTSKEINNKSSDTMIDDEEDEDILAFINEINVEKYKQLTKKDSVDIQDQTNNLESKDECKIERKSSQKCNEAMNISPDLFYNHETANVTTGSRTISHNSGYRTEDLKSRKDGCIEQEKLFNGDSGTRNICDNGLEMRTNKMSNITPDGNTCAERRSTGFDEKMKDLQEKTLNKFKGSILDCLF